MEKKVYSAYCQSFEFRTIHGESWTAEEIIAAYERETCKCPELIGSFGAYDEARKATLDDFGKPLCSTSEERGYSGYVLTGEIYYIAEELYEVEDGEEEFYQELSREYFAEAFEGFAGCP